MRLKKINESQEVLNDNSYCHPINLNNNLGSGLTIIRRSWLDEQLGIDSSDLSFNEIDSIKPLLSLDTSKDEITIYKVHDAYFNEEKKLIPRNGCKGVIYILRDPRDVVISLSNFYKWEFDKTINFLLESKASLCGSPKKGQRALKQYLGTWGQHVKSWTEQNDLPVLVIRYEDLLVKSKHVFKNILDFIQLKVDSKILKKAILNSSFSCLQSKEMQEGGFIDSPYKNNLFFRAGVSGEGMSNLSKQQIRDLESNFLEILIKHNYPITTR